MSFLYDMAPLHFIPAANYSHIVSHSAWLHGVSCPQETVREGFPIRLDSMVFFTDRKLFAKGFLSGLAPWFSLSTGNCSRRVSYSAWLHAVACPQETVRERFPVRLDSTVFLTGRKLFAYSFPSSLTSLRSLPTGNLSPLLPPEIVLLPRRLYFSILRLSIVWGRERCCFLNRKRKSS